MLEKSQLTKQVLLDLVKRTILYRDNIISECLGTGACLPFAGFA